MVKEILISSKFKPFTRIVYKSLHFRIKKIHSAESQVVAGILYKINGDFDINGEDKSNCDVQVWERPWLDTAEGSTGGQTEFSCPDGNVKTYKHKVAKRSIGGAAPGAAKDFSNDEALQLSNQVFNSLATGDSSTRYEFYESYNYLPLTYPF